MGGIININLDKAVSTAINLPTLKGVPLYARVDGDMDNVGLGTKTPEWVEKSKRLYSSPDNLRRLFITYKGVYIELYAPIKGSTNNSLMRESNFGDYNMEEAIHSVLSGDRRYRITRTGIGALVHPWVCSNIEEIYFDSLVLLSEDIMNMGFGNLYQKYTSNRTDKLIDAEVLRKIFDIICKGNNDMSSRFPRLRTIAYASNLEELYHMVKCKPGTKSLIDMTRPWYSNTEVIEAVKNPNNSIAIHNVENVAKMNSRCSLKTGIYTFDREVLEPYFTGLETRINDYKKSVAGKAIDNKKEKLEKKLDGTKSSFEITLDNIYEASGPKAATIALKSSMFGVSKEERNRVLNKMSLEGREKYRRLLSGQGGAINE